MRTNRLVKDTRSAVIFLGLVRAEYPLKLSKISKCCKTFSTTKYYILVNDDLTKINTDSGFFYSYCLKYVQE